MSAQRKRLKINYQIMIIAVLIFILPLSIIGYYFYHTTIDGMRKIGDERVATSVEIAQSLLDDNGKNLLSITKSNSNWEEFRVAIKENNIPWINVNVDENITSVSVLDFIMTTDNHGRILSTAEDIENITSEIHVEKIVKKLENESEFYGLIDTSKGLAFIAVAKVTSEDGLASPTGNLIFGSLLNKETFQYMEETLQVNLGIINSHNKILASSKHINLDTFSKHKLKEKSEISRETVLEENTIIVHASKQIVDISNDPIGLIYIEYPLKTSTNVINNLKHMSISALMIIITLLFILTFILQRRILLPLRHFTLALEQVASGSSIKEIPTHIVSHADTNILQLFDQLHRLSFYDYLTDLPNRRSSSNHLTQILKRASEKKEKVAVIYLDLDRFKNINDSLGHHTGDELLKIVAKRLIRIVADKGIVARLGGDEFTIILSNIESMDEVKQVAESISVSFSEPLIVADYDLFVTSSMGISIFPNDGQTAETLFMNADVAMYRAKEQGRNKYQFYNSNMNSTLIDKLKIETALQKAIDNNELFLTYQPKIHTETNEIIGMEALIRWLHPNLGIIGPNDFIPIAEETGLINSIGKWVLTTACTQNKMWQEQGMPNLKVAVNISARQFQHEDFIETISSILIETGLDPKWLEIEITESTVMNYADDTIKILYELEKMGVSVSIDDFGTGYSSLSYLKLFPIKSLKIDRSFIKDIESNTGDLAIAKSVITLGHALNFEVVAEGVENPQHYDILKNLNCDISQGYYHSPPVTADIFEKMLKEKNTRVSD
ncbi:EAL domain-containing protein [Bacillus timonensis]|nr:EAL domain-containing protein [Bacillus timonensis]